MAHDFHVPGGTRHSQCLRDNTLLLRALNQVVDQNTQAAAWARPKLAYSTGKIIHAV